MEENIKSKISIRKIVIISSIVLTIIALILVCLTNRKLTGKEIGKLTKSVLTLMVYDNNHNLLGTGSGFVCINNQTLVTNYHVIEGGYFIEAISEDDVHYNMSGCMYTDMSKDIAVLKFESPTKIPVLKLGKEKSIIVGDSIWTIGSPLGIKNVVSSGIISMYRENDEYIQFTAPISHGSSGGALLDSKGKVLGITSAMYDEGQNLNLAIPVMEFDNLDISNEKTFEQVIRENIGLGNSIENSYLQLGQNQRFTENDEYIIECFNDDYKIVLHNKKTKEDKILNINGNDINVYDNYIYYVTCNTVHKYDINTDNDVELINPNSYSLDIFVTSNGILVELPGSELVLYNFEGKEKSRYNYINDGILEGLYDKDYLILVDENKISFLNIKNLVVDWNFEHQHRLELDNVFYSKGKLLITTLSKCYLYDLISQQIKTDNINEFNECTVIYFKDDKVYYYIRNKGTFFYDFNTDKEICISNKYAFVNLVISEDNVLYGKAYEISNQYNEKNLMADISWRSNTEEKYFKIDMNNKNYVLEDIK